MRGLVELSLILVATALVAGGHWLVAGRPNPVLVALPAGAGGEPVALKPGEVRLAEVLGQPAGLLWVDARAPAEWQLNGVPGSVNLSPRAEEPLDAQIAAIVDRLGGTSRVVVYCADANCGLSHEVAEALHPYRDLFGGDIVVLHGGVEVLRAAGVITSSSAGTGS